MTSQQFSELWAYIGPLIGAILGFIGSFLLQRRRESLKRKEQVQIVECVELVNSTVLDKSLPIYGDLQIKSRKRGPDSEYIDVDSLYFAQYRIRNLSDKPIGKFYIKSFNQPQSIWFVINEGGGKNSPEWVIKTEEMKEYIFILGCDRVRSAFRYDSWN